MVASFCIPCINRLDDQNTEQNNNQNNGQNNDKFEVMIEGLASGIYLGLLMLFMIPETIDDFGEVWNSKIKEPLTIYTMALSSICLGLFLVAIVEYLAAQASCCVRAQSTVRPANQQANQPTAQQTVQPTIQAAHRSPTAQISPARDDENPENPETSPLLEAEIRQVDPLASSQDESTADQQANESTVKLAVQPIRQPATGSSTAQSSPARSVENPETEARVQANGQVESTTDCSVCITQKNKMEINEVWSCFQVVEFLSIEYLIGYIKFNNCVVMINLS